MAMIEKVSITNFKSHAQTEIELGRVTALVGPNGCGKTSVLQALGFISQIVTDGWDSTNEFSDFVRRGQNKAVISVFGKAANPMHSTIDNWGVCVSFSPNSSPSAELQLVNDKAKFENLGRNEPLSHSMPGFVTQLLQKAVYFKPWWEALAAPSYSRELRPKLNTNGGNLASVIAYLKKEEDEAFQSIEKDLNELAPVIIKVRPRQTKLTINEKRIATLNGTNVSYDEQHEVLADKLSFDTVSGKDISAYLVSEGSLLTLGLLTVLNSPDAPHLIMFDDIEHGLHPLAQRKLMQLLKVFAEKHNRQIILTTQSPYIVDELEAMDVWVMASDKDGITHYQRLDKGPNAKFALEVLTTGEFLGAEGEDWVLNPLAQEAPVHA